MTYYTALERMMLCNDECADYDKPCVIRNQLDSPVCQYKKRKPQKKEV